MCQTNQKQPRREKQSYATYTSLFESSLSEQLLNFRPVCLCRGENSAEQPKWSHTDKTSHACYIPFRATLRTLHYATLLFRNSWTEFSVCLRYDAVTLFKRIPTFRRNVWIVMTLMCVHYSLFCPRDKLNPISKSVRKIVWKKYLCLKSNRFFFYWRYNPLWVCILQPSSGAIASSRTRFLDHTRHTTVGMTPLDERSVGRRDLYLTTHITHNRQTSMPPVGFEPTIGAGERP